MKSLPIALQLYSVRDELGADFEGTLKKVKEMGYDGVEFAGLCDKSFDEIKNICDNIGLSCVSVHISLDEVSANPDMIIDGYKSLGCKQITIPYLPEGVRPGEGGFDKTVAAMTAVGKKCKEKDMFFAYHNHDFEFVKVGDEYGLDVLYNTISSDLLICQLDTCWVNVGGVNPSEYIRKYAGRMYTVHLKDFVGQKTDNMYGLIGLKEDDGSGVKVEEFDFRPVGYGVQNFPEILKASVEAGAQWVVVEQDRPALGKTPLECAQMSVEYLKSLRVSDILKE